MKKKKFLFPVSLCTAFTVSVLGGCSFVSAKYAKTETGSINLSFTGMQGEIAEILKNGALGRFGDILNDSNELKTLTDGMESDSGRNDTYIANFDAVKPEDKDLLNGLFSESDLLLDLDGDGEGETPVQVIIKRDNIDGYGGYRSSSTDSGIKGTGNLLFSYTLYGCEMTIYMTAEYSKMTNGTGSESLTVYAAVFTCKPLASDLTKPDGEWKQLGDMYIGTATENDYSGGSGEGSFNTGTWTLSADTKVISGYDADGNPTYSTVAKGSNISTILNSLDKSYWPQSVGKNQ